MAEYVNRQDLIKFLDNIQQPKMPITEGFKYITIDEAIKVVSERHIADVIERSEYEYLQKENRELAIKYDNAMNMVINEQENITRLRSKIDKAIEKTYKIRQEVLHNDNECYEPNDVLDIIDEISKLFEEL